MFSLDNVRTGSIDLLSNRCHVKSCKSGIFKYVHGVTIEFCQSFSEVEGMTYDLEPNILTQ